MQFESVSDSYSAGETYVESLHMHHSSIGMEEVDVAAWHHYHSLVFCFPAFRSSWLGGLGGLGGSGALPGTRPARLDRSREHPIASKAHQAISMQSIYKASFAMQLMMSVG